MEKLDTKLSSEFRQKCYDAVSNADTKSVIDLATILEEHHNLPAREAVRVIIRCRSRPNAITLRELLW